MNQQQRKYRHTPSVNQTMHNDANSPALQLLVFAKRSEFHLFFMAKYHLFDAVLDHKQFIVLRRVPCTDALSPAAGKMLICDIIDDSDIDFVLQLHGLLISLTDKFHVVAALIGTCGGVNPLVYQQFYQVFKAHKFDRGGSIASYSSKRTNKQVTVRETLDDMKTTKKPDDTKAIASNNDAKNAEKLHGALKTVVKLMVFRRREDKELSTYVNYQYDVKEHEKIVAMSSNLLVELDDDHDLSVTGYDRYAFDMETFDFVKICEANGVVVGYVLLMVADMCGADNKQKRREARFDNLSDKAIDVMLSDTVVVDALDFSLSLEMTSMFK